MPPIDQGRTDISRTDMNSNAAAGESLSGTQTRSVAGRHPVVAWCPADEANPVTDGKQTVLVLVHARG